MSGIGLTDRWDGVGESTPRRFPGSLSALKVYILTPGPGMMVLLSTSKTHELLDCILAHLFSGLNQVTKYNKSAEHTI